MKNFMIKSVNVILILGLIFLYNTKVDAYEQEVAAAQASADAAWAAAESAEAAEESSETAYADGSYQGTATGFGGDITVSVTIEGGEITDVEILSAEDEDQAYLEMAEDVLDEIIEAQSADVDTVSGATFSSTGIKDAAAEALEKAVN